MFVCNNGNILAKVSAFFFVAEKNKTITIIKKNSYRGLKPSLAHARLSRSKERVWSNCILRFVQACQEILGMLIG